MTERNKALNRYRAGVSNTRGRVFEDAIRQGCAWYAHTGKAKVEKIPEPFRVTEKRGNGVFVGRFTAHAQPDFQGTLDGGRSIIFEAKYTATESMKRDVLTQMQMDTLEAHHRCGALAGVCVGIQESFFFVPWPIWKDMKKHFGRLSVTAEDLEPFGVAFNGAVLFLDYIHSVSGRWISGSTCDVNKWRKER